MWLRFMLTQHSRDASLLKGLITELGCGRYFPRSNKDYGEFIVEKFSDIIGKIIPLFEKFPLQGVKRENFEDFKKVAFLMQSKAHLNPVGLEEIRKIKSGMNTQKQYSINEVNSVLENENDNV